MSKTTKLVKQSVKNVWYIKRPSLQLVEGIVVNENGEFSLVKGKLYPFMTNILEEVKTSNLKIYQPDDE